MSPRELTPGPVPAGRIAFLDYLRIFAFASVLIGHKYYDRLQAVANDPDVHASQRLLLDAVLPFLYGGGAGVVTFFLVSGYIITHVLQTETTLEFLVKRFFRIYPLYVAAVLIELAPNLYAGRWPSLSTLVPQLLLVGDLFGTPYSLAAVEWTLRAEVAFYAFMALMNALRNVKDRPRLLPYAFIAATLLLRAIAPVPGKGPWIGYFTIYAPLLFLGAMIYLYQRRQAGAGWVALVCAIVFEHYFTLIATHQPHWLGAHFALLAFGLFAVVWHFRGRISLTPGARLLSDLTYAVYLFHLWGLDYIGRALAAAPFAIPARSVVSLAILIAFCYAMVRLVEQPGIRLGRRVLARLRLAPPLPARTPSI